MKKYVRFNYFEPKLVPAEVNVLEEYGEEINQYPAESWDMQPLLNYFIQQREFFNPNVELGTEYSEIEKDSLDYDDRRNIYTFQLSKLRETNIPSKKRFGEIKENILINRDEYIGEFNSFIYDNEYSSLVMQSNLYGLTVKQAEHVLTNLRFSYLDRIGETEQNPLVVKLNPLIDYSKVDRVTDADYYKKIKLRASDVLLNANQDDQTLLTDAARLLNQYSGVNIEVAVSLGRAEKTASLDQENVREVINQYLQLQGERPHFEITSSYNEDTDNETINLIEPRMTDRISIEIQPRVTVGHQYLSDKFIEDIYDQRRPDVRRVMVPLQ
ncbi:DUF6731 family protein [Geomicrobium sediminis]|uniref:Uncharacterized protein n=1 Tax=Geomicrobium sediminis TaxID=1347788 RepID=A0ABS2PFM0_9BACL|nr:DUF6731 family protein [Geomicrobium sediminis]MBM7634062.1 hypothetical protein [Geomicrobium sediminis]